MSIPTDPERLLAFLKGVAQTLPESFFAGYVVSVLSTRKVDYKVLDTVTLERLQKDIEVELRERDNAQGNEEEGKPVELENPLPVRRKETRVPGNYGNDEPLDFTKHASVKEE